MSIVLPDELVWVLDLLGHNWPEADEDRLFAAAHDWHCFATELDLIAADTVEVAATVEQTNAGPGLDSFLTAQPVDHEQRELGVRASNLTGTMLEAAGTVTQLTKLAILGILAWTATQIIIAQLAAPETFGASELEALVAEEAGRQAVRRTLADLRQTTARDITGTLRTRIEDALRRIDPDHGLRMESRRSTSSGGRAGRGARDPNRSTTHAYHRAPDEIVGIPGLRMVPSRTPTRGGGALRRRWVDRRGNIYEWDSQHAALEKYNSRGEHLGEFDHLTGAQIKPAVRGRHIRRYL